MNQFNRRKFIKTSSLGLMGTRLIGFDIKPDQDFRIIRETAADIISTGKELVVQPVLRHCLEEYKPQTSWRNWGDVHTLPAALKEVERITEELENMKKSAVFPLKILQVKRAASHEEGEKIKSQKDYDVLLLYAAGAEYDKGLDPCIPDDRYCLVFVRHTSGPMYDWYENASNRLLRKDGEKFEIDSLRYYNGVGPDDVIVDDYTEVLWRLKALYGLHNFIGKRIIALGGAGGKFYSKAPELARARFKMEILETSYDHLQERLISAMKDTGLSQKVSRRMSDYLKIPMTKINTDMEFIRKAFYLYYVFKDIMAENGSTAFTINSCMRTIMKVAETTACLPLSLLNDEGYLAFCESDFVVIPSGILLHYISGKPVFLHNPAYPHRNIVLCAHCTSPRRMDGINDEPAEILTHYESDYGAAIKVEMKINQKVTLIDPDAAQERWLGIEGEVIGNPFLPACRSQQEIRFTGDTDLLRREIRGSHWMMAYGSWTREVGYAARKLGMDWLNISSNNYTNSLS